MSKFHSGSSSSKTNSTSWGRSYTLLSRRGLSLVALRQQLPERPPNQFHGVSFVPRVELPCPHTGVNDHVAWPRPFVAPPLCTNHEATQLSQCTDRQTMDKVSETALPCNPCSSCKPGRPHWICLPLLSGHNTFYALPEPVADAAVPDAASPPSGTTTPASTLPASGTTA